MINKILCGALFLMLLFLCACTSLPSSTDQTAPRPENSGSLESDLPWDPGRIGGKVISLESNLITIETREGQVRILTNTETKFSGTVLVDGFMAVTGTQQADDTWIALEITFDQPKENERSAEESRLFSQSLGVNYSTEKGFLAAYRIESLGPFWNIKNDFAGIYDKLELTPLLRYPVGLFTFSAEIPASLTWEFPDQLMWTYAATARVAFQTQTDTRAIVKGWSLASEMAIQANGTNPDPAQPTAGGLTTSTNSRYRGSVTSQVAYYNDIVIPTLGSRACFDLGTAVPTDLGLSWSLSRALGSPQRTLKLSGDSTLASNNLSCLLSLEMSWDKWTGRVEWSTKGTYSAIFGLRL